MPKKPPKNAYFYFMLEYKLAEEKRGRFMNIRQISDKCSGPWKVNHRFFFLFLLYLLICFVFFF